MLKISYLTLILSLMLAFQTHSQTDAVIYLTKGKTTVGILPVVGGRVVFLSCKNGTNLLKADTAQWNEPASARPVPGPETQWKAYNGHIVWVGPQSKFWADQEINPAKKAAKDVWPPDPYLIYGSYEILERSEFFIKMQSPVSEVTGLQLTKEITINRDGSVLFNVEAVNRRSRDVSWDLWLNTRIDGFAPAYVPVSNPDNLKIISSSGKQSDTVAYAVGDGFFYFLPASPTPGKKQRSSKAFLTPSANWIASFHSKTCFRIEFPLYPADKVHPEQGMVEIYNFTSPDVSEALTELEYHGPYTLLGPGERMQASETWSFFSYRGENKPESHIRFLRRKFMR